MRMRLLNHVTGISLGQAFCGESSAGGRLVAWLQGTLSDRGVQYLSIHYTERLALAGIEPSVGSRGDSYDNALAETIIGLYKNELIRPRGPWRNLEDVELATLEWVWWFNHHRLFEPHGHIPPAEYEELYYSRQNTPVEPLTLKSNSLR